jgi:NACHT domain
VNGVYRQRRGLDKLPKWRRSRPLMRTVKVASGAAVLLLAAEILVAGFLVVRRDAGNAQPDLLNATCTTASFSCGVILGTVTPLLLLAAAYMVFLLFRLSRVHGPYVQRAQKKPLEVVQTAGRIIDEVVGRDQLCRVMMQDLFDPGTRRPHVVVGGVGAGKTALIVQLTKLLAERGAVPVPVRLRDAQDDLDFRELGRRRFLADAEGALLTDADRERVWWELCKNDRIVVLADGLEEALIEGGAEKDRDNLIRLAIRRSDEHGLPLVVASRPHDPLRSMDATIVELEPLSEEAALQYVQGASPGLDEHRLDWVVETADVAETPMYLHITRELHRRKLMEWLSPSRAGGQLDTRSIDRAELRLRLLDAWTKALEEGQFPPGLALSRPDRQATILQLSALACVGLLRDSLYVRFDELEDSPTQDSTVKGTGAGQGRGAARRAGPGLAALPGRRRPPAPHRVITETVKRQLPELGGSFDLRLAAARGTELGLVETFGDGVRFPHSIMQAYLGSRLIGVAMADRDYRGIALQKPGRELLIALVMHSRAERRSAPPNSTSRVSARAARSFRRRRPMQAVLSDAACGRDDVKALDLYAAALEIDSVDGAPGQTTIAAKLEEQWLRIASRDLRTLEEAKLNLVRRFGDAARNVVALRRGEPAYRQLYAIGCLESSYPIRVAAAQEIGGGGDKAFAALEGVLGPPDRQVATLAEVGRRPARPSVVTRQPQHPDDENRRWRKELMQAWLAPLLVGSVTERGQDARRHLEKWLEFIGAKDLGRNQDLRLSLEIALAQGFKHAANRRRSHATIYAHDGGYLFEQARTMLRGARFWFSRLTLVHALCLWSLSDDTGRQRSTRRHVVDLEARVKHWLAAPDGRPEHPLVAEAGKLVVLALETGEPERFLWIDESGVLGRVGSLPTSRESRRKHNLWIPPSTGWTALDRRAQQLVADVLLLLNLAERGDQPSDRERRLRRANRNELPPCLAGDRSRLAVDRTAGMATTSQPGSNCAPGCRFELCPYPAKGERYYRVELTEAFCRRQRMLVNKRRVWRRAGAAAGPWQGGRPRALAQFWKQMEERTQPSDRP